MEKFSGKKLIKWKVETDTAGYPIKAEETYVVDHHSQIDGKPEYVTLTAWENSHSRDNYPVDKKTKKEYGQFVGFPKTEKIEIRLRQDLADKLPKDKKEKNTFICRAIEYAIDKDTWLEAHNKKAQTAFEAAKLGRVGGKSKSKKKKASSAENGKKGGRPKKRPPGGGGNVLIPNQGVPFPNP